MHKVKKSYALKYTFIQAYIFCIVFLVGCNYDVHNHPELVTGQQLFEYHCARCHKETGTGNFLKGIRPNKGTRLTIYQIAQKIYVEEETSKMPSFPNMSAKEAAKIASYLKEL